MYTKPVAHHRDSENLALDMESSEKGEKKSANDEIPLSLEGVVHELKKIKRELASSNAEVEKLKIKLGEGEIKRAKTDLSDVSNKEPHVKPLGHAWNGLRYHIHYKDYYEKKLRIDCSWQFPPRSVVGRAFQKFLGSKDFQLDLLFDSLFSYLGAFPLGVFIQIYVLRRLWTSLPDFSVEPNFCQNIEVGAHLQLCAVGVFLLSAGQAFNDIFLEVLIVMTSTHRCRLHPSEKWVKDAYKERYCQEKFGAYDEEKEYDKDEIPDGVFVIPEVEFVSILTLTWNYWTRAFLMLLVLMEAAVWLTVVIVGVKYLMSSKTISDLVQSTVAIVFINDVDNMVFELTATSDMTGHRESTEYKLPVLAGDDGVKKRAIFGNRFDKFFMWLKTPDKREKAEKEAAAQKEKAQSDAGPVNAQSEAAQFNLSEWLNEARNLQWLFQSASLYATFPVLVFTSAGVVYGLHWSYCQ